MLVRARGLTKRFGDFTAVDGIDFDLYRGEAFGFLGANGAGKSSTMRMIGCVSPPSGGELTILGTDPVRDGSAIRARIGVVPQDDTLDVEPHPRRAHHRPGPAGQARGVGPAVPAQAARRHADPDHALHGRRGTAVRPAGGHGSRDVRRRGLAPRSDHALRSPEVLELRFDPGLHDLAADKLKDFPAERAEVLADRILLYVTDGDAALAAVRSGGLEPLTSLVRRGTLEDVFLRLTGRRLED